MMMTNLRTKFLFALVFVLLFHGSVAQDTFVVFTKGCTTEKFEPQPQPEDSGTYLNTPNGKPIKGNLMTAYHDIKALTFTYYGADGHQVTITFKRNRRGEVVSASAKREKYITCDPPGKKRTLQADTMIGDWDGSGCGQLFCRAHGDPHFLTWNGTYYDFHGECDLVLFHAPKFAFGTGLDIHLRTKVRYDYSYIETAAIRLGDDVLEVSSFGDYAFNGVSQANLDGTPSGFAVSHETTSTRDHKFHIDLGYNIDFTVKTFKDFVSVNLGYPLDEISLEWFQTSTGMVGSFQTGAMLARDGVTVITDPNEFGQEWMVRYNEPKLFEVKDRPPQYPAKCVFPSAAGVEGMATRRLGEGISKKDAEKACSRHGKQQAREACIRDVLADGDLDLAFNIDYDF